VSFTARSAPFASADDHLAAGLLLHEQGLFECLLVELVEDELEELAVDVLLAGSELELLDEVRDLLDGHDDSHLGYSWTRICSRVSCDLIRCMSERVGAKG